LTRVRRGFARRLATNGDFSIPGFALDARRPTLAASSPSKTCPMATSSSRP